MRIPLYIFVLLLSAFPVFGQRVYLRKEYLENDIYVINKGTEDEPDLEVSFLLYESGVDSVFVVVSERDLPELNTYFRAVRDKFLEWSEVARKNKITEFKKPFDIYPPELRIRWTQHPWSDFWYERRLVKTYQSKKTNVLPLDFSVVKGRMTINGRFNVADETDEKNYGIIRVYLSARDLKDLIKWADIQRVKKTYLKNRPKMSAEEIDALFE